MNINKTRGLLYKIARILGDVQAAKNGRLGKRIACRAAGKATGTLNEWDFFSARLHPLLNKILIW
ncbi:hypothetical protein ACLFK3_12575 [Bacillus siamensis]|uniref:hypothetical protein n=1 Tax=Bacillus siamensis TaxID=659243 RepID=UPI0039E7FA82